MKKLEQSGQTIAIYAITLLALALITMFTVSVGVRVREKIKVQSAADASAYGLAVTQARAMNVMAWSNRAIVAEYVSALSVISHESYLNYWEGMLQGEKKAMSGPIWEYGLQGIGCPFGCSCCCMALQSAKQAKNIQNMWDQQYQKVHKIWHVNGKPLHTALHMLDVAYIGGAVVNYAAGVQAYGQYLATSPSSFADKAGKAVDPRIKAKTTLSNTKNFTEAVEVDPAAEDWDSYHEILSGTRTDWILNQKKFVKGIPWITGVAKSMQMAASCGGTTVNMPPSANGGAMTIGGTHKSVSGVVQVNTSNGHAYQSGAALGEGGRFALGSIDWGRASVVMICRACEPVTYGSSSTSPEQDLRKESPKGCWKDSISKSADGYDEGDSNSGANHIWTSANGVAQFSGKCQDQGITAGGFFRFKLNGDKLVGAKAQQKDLWRQPYTAVSLSMDAKPQNGNNQFGNNGYPWDIDFGHIGGSLLTLDASKDASGGSNNGGASSLSGKGYDSLVWPTIGALSSGLTYYHNPDHWAEVPNLWNPFWRAKLEDPTDSAGASGAAKDPARHLLLDLSGDDLAVAQAMGVGGF